MNKIGTVWSEENLQGSVLVVGPGDGIQTWQQAPLLQSHHTSLIIYLLFYSFIYLFRSFTMSPQAGTELRILSFYSPEKLELQAFTTLLVSFYFNKI